MSGEVHACVGMCIYNVYVRVYSDICMYMGVHVCVCMCLCVYMWCVYVYGCIFV